MKNNSPSKPNRGRSKTGYFGVEYGLSPGCYSIVSRMVYAAICRPHTYDLDGYAIGNVLLLRRRDDREKEKPDGITKDPAFRKARAKELPRSNLFFLKNLNRWSGFKNKTIIYREIATLCRRRLRVELESFSIIKAPGTGCMWAYCFILWKTAVLTG